MRNSNRLLVIVCSTAAVLLCAIALLAQRLLIRSFERIETDLVQQSIAQMRKALDVDLRQLELNNRDYAQWDDTYRFMLTGDPGYIHSNYRKETLAGLQVDLIWIIDTHGRDVYSVEQRKNEGTTISPAPVPLLDELKGQIEPLSQAAALPPSRRLIRLRGSLAAFSAKPILRTDLSGPTVGHLVWIRFLEADETERLSETSQLAVSLIDLGSDASRARLPRRALEWIDSPLEPGSNADLFFAQNADDMAGYALLHDVRGNPAALLATTVRRDVAVLGKHTARSLIGLVAALVLIFVALVLVLFVWLGRTSRARAASELQNRRKLMRLARHDALTGLPNRLYLQARLPRLLARAMRAEKRLALLYIDIDHFKNINDSTGHGSGDAVLCLIAERLRAVVAAHDVIVRMGGDEFVIVATGLADRAAAEAMAQRLMGALRAPIERDSAVLSMTVSMGVSIYPEDGLDLEGLLKHADIALYQAKDGGRNNYQLFAADMNVRLMERVALEQALRRAIGTEQLFVEYQPIVDVSSGALIALEALLRWQHPDLGLVPPARFIPVAEHSGAICEIGDHVLRQVCRQLSEWMAEAVPLVPVCVNISPRQFERGRLPDTVERATRELDVDPSLLTFEITEDAVMHDINQYIGTLHALRRLGARIAVDDFGTGYSSLSYLKHLPIDSLKIDRAFIRDMASDSNDAAIVTAIVSMARSLGLRTIAEGVETADQLDRLRALGCDAAQGFYLGRPVAARLCRMRLEQSTSTTGRRDALRHETTMRVVGSAG